VVQQRPFPTADAQAPGLRVSAQRDVNPGTAQAAGVTPALLHEIGIGAINTYREAAVRGIDLFVRDMSGPFNWVMFWGSVAGNLMWAAACFETFGTAFAISLGGIGVGSVSQLATPDSEGFSTAAEDRTDLLVSGMRDQITTTGNDVARAAAAASPLWDENRAGLRS
jgi:hypothetical protein